MGWLARSYVGPVILLGLGGIVLAATIWPAGRAALPAKGAEAERTTATETTAATETVEVVEER